MSEDKVRENRLRRMALRQGLHLRRSRRRDQLALDYGVYWLIDAATDTAVTPEAGLSIDEIEACLSDGSVRPSRRASASWEGA